MNEPAATSPNPRDAAELLRQAAETLRQAAHVAAPVMRVIVLFISIPGLSMLMRNR